MIKKIAIGLGFSVALVALGVIAWLHDPLPSNPDPDVLAAPASQYDVEIIRDSWGVPHIYGMTNADTAFGVGYAHAEDDFETIQDVVAATRGTLARYKGMSAAPTDYVVGLLDVWGTVEARYEADVPAEVKAIADAYAHGVNLYASEHPDETWAGLVPFTGKDVVAGFILKTPFFYGFDGTLMELLADSRDAPLATDPNQQSWLLHPTLNTARGSNAFAVAPSRSADGKTRLIINSHQPMTGPVAWWEAHTVSEEGLDITGGLFPGTPVILHGFNQHLGWANTVSKPDLTDVYRLELSPNDDTLYRMDGQWKSFEEDTVTIKVKLWGPFVFPAKRKIKRTVHGPVIEAEHGTYAVRYAGMGEIRQLEQYIRLNHAESLSEFSDAMAMNALPSINYIYADKEGNIAFIHNGQYPDRIEDWDWQADLPGDRSDLIWQDYIPYADGPKLINPQSGFIFNANNTPYSATDGPDNIQLGDYPETLGLQENQTNRALRILELTDGESLLSRDDLLAIKFDTAFATGSDADLFIRDVLANDWSGEPDMQAAAEHLAAWDYQMNIDDRHAALGSLTVLRHVTGQFTGDYGPEPAQAFRDAVQVLNEHHGGIDPEWGQVNRLARGDLSLPVGGGSGSLRSIHPKEWPADTGILEADGGDTWMALIEWDEGGKQSAQVVHQFGSATLDETSPHYADQAELFVREEWRTALLTREAIEADAARIYRPGRD
ncbi:MAG: acylase [Pseudomonadota bacterium]